MSRLTILICTHDRAGLLERALASLNAARPPPQWEVDILVAANACSDGTHALLDAYGKQAADRAQLPLTWFAEATPGKSHALNSAMPRLTGELVAFVDDDHRVDAGYLEAVCAAAASYPQAGLFCGRILPDWDGNEPAWVHDKGPYRIYPLPVPRFDLGDAPRAVTSDLAIPGCGNLFLRTEWLDRVFLGMQNILPVQGADHETCRINGVEIRASGARPDTAYCWIKPEEIATVPGFLEDLPEIRRELAGYYTNVPRLDDAVGAVLAWRVDVNEFSMHYFYKNRLVRCYLGASRDERDAHPFTGLDLADDLQLATLRTKQPCVMPDQGTSRDPADGYVGLLPVLNTVLNLVKGDDLAWQERKAQSFVFTPLFSGYEHIPPRERRTAERKTLSCGPVWRYA